jgi:hypothetical protein
MGGSDIHLIEAHWRSSKCTLLILDLMQPGKLCNWEEPFFTLVSTVATPELLRISTTKFFTTTSNCNKKFTNLDTDTRYHDSNLRDSGTGAQDVPSNGYPSHSPGA